MKVGAYLEPALSTPITMNPTITTQDYPEPRDLTSTSFCSWTNSQPMGWPASPTDSVSSMLTLCGPSSLTLCHSWNGSDASLTSLQADLSKLKPSCVESIHPSTIDPISAIETNLDQAFSRMWSVLAWCFELLLLLIPTIKVVFTGELNQHSKYEELAKCLSTRKYDYILSYLILEISRDHSYMWFRVVSTR